MHESLDAYVGVVSDQSNTTFANQRDTLGTYQRKVSQKQVTARKKIRSAQSLLKEQTEK